MPTARSMLIDAVVGGEGAKGLKRVWQKVFGVEQHDVEQVLDGLNRNRILTLDWLAEEGILPGMPQQSEDCICPVKVKWELLRSSRCPVTHREVRAET